MALGRQNLLTEPPADLGLIAGFGDSNLQPSGYDLT